MRRPSVNKLNNAEMSSISDNDLILMRKVYGDKYIKMRKEFSIAMSNVALIGHHYRKRNLIPKRKKRA